MAKKSVNRGNIAVKIPAGFGLSVNTHPGFFKGEGVIAGWLMKRSFKALSFKEGLREVNYSIPNNTQSRHPKPMCVP